MRLMSYRLSSVDSRLDLPLRTVPVNFNMRDGAFFLVCLVNPAETEMRSRRFLILSENADINVPPEQLLYINRYSQFGDAYYGFEVVDGGPT